MFVTRPSRPHSQLRLKADSIAECEQALRSAMAKMGPQVAVVAPGLAVRAAPLRRQCAPSILRLGPHPGSGLCDRRFWP